MLAVLSPAKNLNFDPVATAPTEPEFAGDAVKLARAAGRLSRARLKAMMELSDELAELNYRRFKAFQAEPALEHVKPAAHAFNGDTYQGLQFDTLDPEAVAHAEGHLRILSGLYGLLRPHDGIQPYRLEMGRRLKTRAGETLYAYWGTRIAEALDRAAEGAGASHIVNLASVEYFTAAKEAALKTPVLHPVFKDEKNGALKVISFNAKRARGAMARFMMEQRAARPEDLHGFTWEGYRYQPDLSEEGAPVFVRPEAAAAAAA